MYKDIEIYNQFDQCNCFNKYFAKMGHIINNYIFISSEKNSFYFLPITNNEIINVADSMK